MRSFPNATNRAGENQPNINNAVQQANIEGFDTERIKAFNFGLTVPVKNEFINPQSMNISNFARYTSLLSFDNISDPSAWSNPDNRTEQIENERNAALHQYENPFKLPIGIIRSADRYNKVFKAPLYSVQDYYAENAETLRQSRLSSRQSQSSNNQSNGDGTNGSAAQSSTTPVSKPAKEDAKLQMLGAETVVVSSMFNPTFMIQVGGITDNIPLRNYIPDGVTSPMALTQEEARALAEQEYNFNETASQYRANSNTAASAVPAKPLPTRDEVFAKWDSIYRDSQTQLQSMVMATSHANVTNCTIRELVRLSHNDNTILGQARYKYADFMYCRDLGKVSNNHMITLRKFAHPIGDNIFRFSSPRHRNSEGYMDYDTMADVGRLVTWFGTDSNKLSDILNYSMHATWKEFNAEIQEIDTRDDDAAGGLIGTLTNSLNPSYNSLVGAGMAGSQSVWTTLGTKLFNAPINSMGKLIGGDGNSVADSNGTNPNSMGKWDLLRMSADTNKIYTPQDTIQSTHKYEGKLEFTNDFTLTFDYKLRAYDNINPKTAMLDLLGNILEVTYRRGKFWGGSRRFIGPPHNQAGWVKANHIIDNSWDKLEGFMRGLLTGNVDWGGILSSISDFFNGMIKSATEFLRGGYKELGQKIVEVNDKYRFSTALKGQLKNKLGRPAVYAMNSLLSGDDVGLWHVTIGNPKNPIAAFGNLILENATVTHSGVLGLDDFPTEIRVQVQLKHARPRDLTEISRMYNKGTSTMYNPIGNNKLKSFFALNSSSYVDENGNTITRDIDDIIDEKNEKQFYYEQGEMASERLADEVAKAEQDVQRAEEAKKKAEQREAQQKGSSTEKSSSGGSTGDVSNNTDQTSEGIMNDNVLNNSSNGEQPDGSKDENGTQNGELTVKQAVENLSQAKTRLAEKKKALAAAEAQNKGNKTEYDRINKIVSGMMAQTAAGKGDHDDEMDNPLIPPYINTATALRYETLGHDRDYIGRIVMDEIA